MKKHQITKKMLMWDDCSSAFVILSLLPAVGAIVSAYFGIKLIKSDTVIALLLLAAFAVCITVVIHLVIALCYFVQEKIDIAHNRFVIFEDVIERKSAKESSTAVYFKKYNKKVPSPIYFNVTDFQKAKVGDKYLMVKLDREERILYFYPSAKYQLHKDLQEQKVKIGDAYPK